MLIFADNTKLVSILKNFSENYKIQSNVDILIV